MRFVEERLEAVALDSITTMRLDYFAAARCIARE
jgi:hypothetical protein